MLQNTHSGSKRSKNALKDVVTENEEQKVLSNITSPNDTGVTFEDIGALDNVKETLRELVMLPLQRPELFRKGQLRKPVKGILLFGPPGTGKTMLANRPYDLNDAVIRRFPRRIMVSLPDASNREKILKVLLSKEPLAPDVDLESVANMTEGCSGSDLKNLCVTAAYRPICEILEKEKKEKSLAISLLYGCEDVRSLGMDDLKSALGQVGASLSPDSVIMNRIVQWDNEFGDSGLRKKET